jgi:hypothetical protein
MSWSPLPRGGKTRKGFKNRAASDKYGAEPQETDVALTFSVVTKQFPPAGPNRVDFDMDQFF